MKIIFAILKVFEHYFLGFFTGFVVAMCGFCVGTAFAVQAFVTIALLVITVKAVGIFIGGSPKKREKGVKYVQR